MAKSLVNNLGYAECDNLFNNLTPSPDVVTVSLAASQGVLKRGSLISGTAGSTMTLVSKALVSTNAIYVLADDTDATTATTAAAYRTGHFNAGYLLTGSEYALTAADKEVLRDQGILVSDAVEYIPPAADEN